MYYFLSYYAYMYIAVTYNNVYNINENYFIPLEYLKNILSIVNYI